MPDYLSCGNKTLALPSLSMSQNRFSVSSMYTIAWPSHRHLTQRDSNDTKQSQILHVLEKDKQAIDKDCDVTVVLMRGFVIGW